MMYDNINNSFSSLTDDEIEILEIYHSASQEEKELLVNKILELLDKK